MPRLIRLLQAELMRAWLELVRYPLQFLMGLVLVGLIFYLLFGFARLAGAIDTGGYQTAKLIIGYVLGIFAMAIISGPAQQVSKEAKSGTLENMVLSGQGLTAFFVVQVLARSWLFLLQIGVLLVVLALIFKSTYSFSWLLLPAFLLFLLTALGLGLMVGALMLLFKEVNQIFVLIQFLVFPAVIVEVPQLEWFPLMLAASSLRSILLGGWVEPLQWATLALGTVAVYSLGVYLFRASDTAARRRGLLGHE